MSFTMHYDTDTKVTAAIVDGKEYDLTNEARDYPPAPSLCVGGSLDGDTTERRGSLLLKINEGGTAHVYFAQPELRDGVRVYQWDGVERASANAL